jgi:hypothetical protein
MIAQRSSCTGRSGQLLVSGLPARIPNVAVIKVSGTALVRHAFRSVRRLSVKEPERGMLGYGLSFGDTVWRAT